MSVEPTARILAARVISAATCSIDVTGSDVMFVTVEPHALSCWILWSGGFTTLPGVRDPSASRNRSRICSL